MSKLNLFVPITKIDAEKRLVYGVLADETKDIAGEIFDYEGSKPYFEAWSKNASKLTDGKSAGNLRSMHGNVAAGKFTTVAFNDAVKSIETCAEVVDDNEWRKVESGVYTGLSLGGKYVKRWKKGDEQRYIADPCEGSLVDLPCNPSATFQVVRGAEVTVCKFLTPDPAADPADLVTKALAALTPEQRAEVLKAAGVPAAAEQEPGAQPAKPAAQETPELPSNDAIAAKAEELAKAAGKAGRWVDFIEAAKAALAKPNPAGDTPREPVAPAASSAPRQTPAAGAPLAEKAQAGDGPWRQVWESELIPGKTFATKAALRAALVEKEAADKATAAAAPLTAALTDLNAALDKKGAPKAEPAKAAVVVVDQPIDLDITKLFAADGTTTIKDVAALAQAALVVAAGELSRAPVRLLKRRLVALAHKMKAPADTLPEKWRRPAPTAGDQVAKAASLYGVSNLLQLLASLEDAEESLEYNSYYTGALNVPKELCDRMGAIVVELGDCVAAVLDVILTAMREEEAGEAIGRAAPIVDLLKIGARNNRTDKQRIKAIHDAAAQLDDGCCPAEKEAAVTVDDVQKRADAAAAAFDAKLGEMLTVVKDVAERVKRIEDTPLPAGPQVLRVAEKGGDSASAQAGMPGAEDAPLSESVLKQLADLAVRQAHKSPLRAIPGLRQG